MDSRESVLLGCVGPEEHDPASYWASATKLLSGLAAAPATATRVDRFLAAFRGTAEPKGGVGYLRFRPLMSRVSRNLMPGLLREAKDDLDILMATARAYQEATRLGDDPNAWPASARTWFDGLDPSSSEDHPIADALRILGDPLLDPEFGIADSSEPSD